MKERCLDCRYFIADGYVCRRYPPALQLLPAPASPDGEQHVQYSGCFPPVNPDWWCGEFIPAKGQGWKQ